MKGTRNIDKDESLFNEIVDYSSEKGAGITSVLGLHVARKIVKRYLYLMYNAAMYGIKWKLSMFLPEKFYVKIEKVDVLKMDIRKVRNSIYNNKMLDFRLRFVFAEEYLENNGYNFYPYYRRANSLRHLANTTDMMYDYRQEYEHEKD